ncbi:MAG: M50 family metallopeptidase [Myxococcales bacterium]|nr:M50 family metallopeptidase [Myxococcales bacterium]
MDQSWSFKLLGFRVNVQATFLLLLGIYLLIQLGDQAPLASIVSWPIVVFISIIVHELGHALVAQYYRLKVGHIELHGLGGHVTHSRTTPKKQLAISLAGPAAGLLLGLLVWWVSTTWPPTELWSRTLVTQLLWVNIGWSLINLIPMLPLDGGNALLAGLTLTMRRQRDAMRTTGMVGIVCGIGVAVLGYTGYGMFLTFIGAFAAFESYRLYQQAT